MALMRRRHFYCSMLRGFNKFFKLFVILGTQNIGYITETKSHFNSK